jgi:hypothetical protein
MESMFSQKWLNFVNLYPVRWQIVTPTMIGAGTVISILIIPIYERMDRSLSCHWAHRKIKLIAHDKLSSTTFHKLSLLRQAWHIKYAYPFRFLDTIALACTNLAFQQDSILFSRIFKVGTEISFLSQGINSQGNQTSEDPAVLESLDYCFIQSMFSIDQILDYTSDIDNFLDVYLAGLDLENRLYTFVTVPPTVLEKRGPIFSFSDDVELLKSQDTKEQPDETKVGGKKRKRNKKGENIEEIVKVINDYRDHPDLIELKLYNTPPPEAINRIMMVLAEKGYPLDYDTIRVTLNRLDYKDPYLSLPS